MSRLLDPDNDQVLYHYCSAETLRAILESRTIRFSDINMMNDSQETRWGYSAFEEAATRLINRKNLQEEIPIMEKSFFDSVDEILSKVQLITHPFISCFSLDRDSLSQWRAYADDGRGFAIGFKAKQFQGMPVSLLLVAYEREQQVKEMMTALAAIFMHSDGNPDKDRNTFFEDCVLLGNYMVALKHQAFHEEKEVRCIHAVNIEANEAGMRFVDSGGVTEYGDVEGEKIRFQVIDNHLSAFLDISFLRNGNDNPISEIVMGPKNHSNPGNLMLYLGGLDYSNITITSSDAPYR